MKADAKPGAEKEALEWATGFFHEKTDEMTPDGSRRTTREDAVRGLLLSYDNQSAEAKESIINSVLGAWFGHQYASQSMRDFAASLMERRDPLPDVLLEFIVAFLRNPKKPEWPPQLVKAIARGDSAVGSRIEEARSLLARRPGPGSHDLQARNINIWLAIEYIVRTWNIPATRNQATRRASAVSIVREAIEKGVRLTLTEDAIVKAWRKIGSLPAEQLDMLAKLLDPSEKIAAD